MTGYPWHPGDQLLAADLNAAIANGAALGGAITEDGGTITGPLYTTATGGTVARSEQDRAADVINVKDHGATGNGTTDDTAAIQAALNAITTNGGAVYFPTGIYAISSTLVIPTTGLSPNDVWFGIKIYGDGTGFTRLTHNLVTTPFMTCTVASGSTMFNLTIQDMTFQTYSSSFNAWHIDIQNVQDFTLRRCALWSQNPTQSAIAGLRVRGVGNSIFYIRVENSALMGSTLQLDSITDSWVTGNILQCVCGTGGRASSMHITGSGGGDIRIVNNHIYSANSGGVFCDAPTNAINVVQGNMFDTNPNSTTAIAINVATSGSTWTIGNNIFNAIPAISIQMFDVYTSSICENLFAGCGIGGNAPTIAFNSTSAGCSNITVANNTALINSTVSTPLYFVQENASGAKNNVYLNNQVTGAGYQAVPYNLISNSTPLVNFVAGVNFGSRNAASTTDLSNHITIYYGSAGINVFSGQMNFVAPAWVWRTIGNSQYAYLTSGGFVSMNSLGVWGSGGPASKPTVTGAKGGNAALASLMSALAAYGLVTDSTTA